MSVFLKFLKTLTYVVIPHFLHIVFDKLLRLRQLTMTLNCPRLLSPHIHTTQHKNQHTYNPCRHILCMCVSLSLSFSLCIVYFSTQAHLKQAQMYENLKR